MRGRDQRFRSGISGHSEVLEFHLDAAEVAGLAEFVNNFSNVAIDVERFRAIENYSCVGGDGAKSLLHLRLVHESNIFVEAQ